MDAEVGSNIIDMDTCLVQDKEATGVVDLEGSAEKEEFQDHRFRKVPEGMVVECMVLPDIDEV